MVARQLTAATHFPGKLLARQTGTGEQCSPLQAFFGSSAEGARPLPTEQKEKSASKETCPGEINPAPAHKRQSCNNGKAAGRALGGAQRAPPVCFANTLLRLIAPRGQSLCAPQFRCAQLWPHAHNPAPRRNSGNFLCYFLLLAKESRSSREAAVHLKADHSAVPSYPRLNSRCSRPDRGCPCCRADGCKDS